MNPLRRYLTLDLILDLGPLAVFFVTHQVWGLMIATGAVMGSSLLALLVGYAVKRRIAVFALITVILVLVLGGTSLVLDDDMFIKMKPTIAKCLFALGLAVGLAFRPTLLERALHGQISLTEKGWRILTWRWVCAAILFALANEVVWRSQPTDIWVTFKTALTPISILVYIIVTRLTAPRYWRVTDSVG